MFLILLAWQLCGLVIWQPDNPLYIFLSYMRDYFLLWFGIIVFIGWIGITYYYMSKPLRYLDEIIACLLYTSRCV